MISLFKTKTLVQTLLVFSKTKPLLVPLDFFYPPFFLIFRDESSYVSFHVDEERQKQVL